MPAKGFKLPHKVCKICKEDLPREAFYTYKSSRQGLQISNTCKACHTKKSVAYNRLRATGVTQEVYDEKLLAQAGSCALCKEKQERALSADHCHATGVARGLLCIKCNSLLGYVNDNVQLLQLAIDYLNRYRS